jgi:Tol biopolymer transport system component
VSLRACVTACLVLSAALLVPVGANAQTPAFQIVFQSDRDGSSDLWLVDSTGANERPLTHTLTPEAAPSWSPNGRSIVYACAPEDNWDICAIDVATRVVTRITQTTRAEFDPRYTSDGTQIVMESYSSDRYADIAIVPASGGVPTPLTATPGVDDQDPSPEPGGPRIVFASAGKIAVLASPSTPSVTVVPGGAGSDTDTAFSGGDEITFAGRQGGVAVAGPADAAGARVTRQLTKRSRRSCGTGRSAKCRSVQSGARLRAAVGIEADIEPAWTAAATDLVFARRQTTGPGFRIYTMDAFGRGQRAVTRGGAYNDTEPAAGPAGSISLLERTLRVDVRAASGACGKIRGTAGKNKLKGTAGRDCMWGSGGNDVLSGGAGDDKLTGDRGRDRLNGDAGQDVFYTTDGEQDYISGGLGADQSWLDTGVDVQSSTVVH